jgi:hypothetical protein
MRVSDYMSVLTVKPLVANQPDQPGIEFSLTGKQVYTSYESFSSQQSNFLPSAIRRICIFKPVSSVADPEPNPGRMLLGLLDPDPLYIRGTDPDPDPSMIKQKF